MFWCCCDTAVDAWVEWRHWGHDSSRGDFTELASSSAQFHIQRGSPNENYVSTIALVPNLLIAQGTVLVTARIEQFIVAFSDLLINHLYSFGAYNSGEVKCTITARDVDDSGDWLATLPTFAQVNAAPQTTASVDWVIVANNATVPDAFTIQMASIATVVNEVLARSGWSSGNTLALLFTEIITRPSGNTKGAQLRDQLCALTYS